MITILNEELGDLLIRAEYASTPRSFTHLAFGKYITLWIDEASTRNRISCQRAAHQLGLGLLDASPTQGLSTLKGESLIDTFQVLARYSDCFAIRSPLASLPFLAARWSDRPVLNLGDGWNEHPSQAFATLLAIRELSIDLSKVQVACYGDLDRSRTVRSLALGISQLGGTTVLVDDHSSTRGSEIASTAAALHLPGQVLFADDLDQVDADLLYVCRVQSERRSGDHVGPRPLGIDDVARFRLVLHPLPRGAELESDAWEYIRPGALQHVDRTLKARTFLIESMLDGSLRVGPQLDHDSSVAWTCSNEGCLLSNRGYAGKIPYSSAGRCPGCHSPIR